MIDTSQYLKQDGRTTNFKFDKPYMEQQYKTLMIKQYIVVMLVTEVDTLIDKKHEG